MTGCFIVDLFKKFSSTLLVGISWIVEAGEFAVISEFS
jgi:hypothetical protein